MPPLICPSPVLIDQSFPRDDYTLQIVGASLGSLQELMQQGQIIVVVTPSLQLFLDEFDWQRTDPYPLLQTIYNLLVQWFLQPHEALLVIDLDSVTDSGLHPVPSECEESGLVLLWAEEVAKLLKIHKVCQEGASYFIGVACHHAFAGEAVGTYKGGTTTTCFPLVGMVEIAKLDDAFEWDIPCDLHQRQVSLSDAKRNVFVLGASRIQEPPGGGSHYKVIFDGSARNWVLDRNVDPIPDRFLKELVPVVSLPFEVIKTVLLQGIQPSKVLKLERVDFQISIRFGN